MSEEPDGVTLREFLELKIAHERELRDQNLRHAGELRSILLEDIHRRLASMNEWREQLAQERGNFVQREMYDTRHELLDKRLQLAESTLSGMHATRSTLTWLWGAALGAAALLVAIAHWLSTIPWHSVQH
jgi:hypothetical protein